MALGARKRREIVFALEKFRRHRHIPPVEWERIVVDKAVDEGQRDGRLEDPIAIRFRARVVASVKGGSRLGDPSDADRLGQEVIERHEKARSRDGATGLEVCNLARGVNSGVGAAGAVDFDRSTGDFLERPFERSLNGRTSPLALPAEKIRAVIRDHKLEVAQNFRQGLPTSTSAEESEPTGASQVMSGFVHQNNKTGQLLNR